ERNVTERIAARKEYAIDVSRIPDNNIVFLDETGFNEYLQRHFGYSPINNKAYTIVPANKGINRSVICAINSKGIIRYQYRQGSYNANLFIEFLGCVVVPYFSRNPNAIIVMDNARIYKTNAVLSFLRENRIVFKFNVPYSPQLNPIEEFFLMIKSSFTAKRLSEPELSVRETIDLIFSSTNDYSSQCFYGKPWTLSQRKELFQRLKLFDLNTYFYAPKDDRKHRSYWKELYDHDESNMLKDVIDSAHKCDIIFVYSISPGMDIVYSDKDDQSALDAKINQVVQLGCRNIAILFDDVLPELRLADVKEFENLASAESFLVNQLQKNYQHVRFFLCPNEYCSMMANPTVLKSEYLDTLGKSLRPEINIMWTGPQVVAKEITVAHLSEVRTVLRRKPVLWDNLHANDYDTRRIFVGPYLFRNPNIISHIAGILLNPNCEFEANFVPLYTLGKWYQMSEEESENNETVKENMGCCHIEHGCTRFASFESTNDAFDEAKNNSICGVQDGRLRNNDKKTEISRMSLCDINSNAVVVDGFLNDNYCQCDDLENAIKEWCHVLDRPCKEVKQRNHDPHLLIKDNDALINSFSSCSDPYYSNYQLDKDNDPSFVGNAASNNYNDSLLPTDKDINNDKSVIDKHLKHATLLVKLFYLPYNLSPDLYEILQNFNWLCTLFHEKAVGADAAVKEDNQSMLSFNDHSGTYENDDTSLKGELKTELNDYEDDDNHGCEVIITGQESSTNMAVFDGYKDHMLVTWQKQRAKFSEFTSQVYRLSSWLKQIPNKRIKVDFFSYICEIAIILKVCDAFLDWIEKYNNICNLAPLSLDRLTFTPWLGPGGITVEFQQVLFKRTMTDIIIIPNRDIQLDAIHIELVTAEDVKTQLKEQFLNFDISRSSKINPPLLYILKEDHAIHAVALVFTNDDVLSEIVKDLSDAKHVFFLDFAVQSPIMGIFSIQLLFSTLMAIIVHKYADAQLYSICDHTMFDKRTQLQAIGFVQTNVISQTKGQLIYSPILSPIRIYRVFRFYKLPPKLLTQMKNIGGNKYISHSQNKVDQDSVTPDDEPRWSDYFDEKVFVKLPVKDLSINVYKVNIDSSKESTMIMLLLHGAGASSLSWARFVHEMKLNHPCSCSCLAVDIRGHGDSTIGDNDDLHMSSLVDDICMVLDQQHNTNLPLCIVGHSLGGSIAINLAERLGPDIVKFLVVVDLTEGNALSCLTEVEKFLISRPSTFPTMNDAIKYLVSSRQVRNPKSASISAYGYFKYLTDGDVKVDTSSTRVLSVLPEDEHLHQCQQLNDYSNAQSSKSPPLSNASLFDNKVVIQSQNAVSYCGNHPVKWRVQLSDTREYWDGWFRGVSSRFLNLCMPKLLILSNLHNLDTELTIGQMQGKFQFEVFRHTGHALNEDVPNQLSDVIVTALKRYRLIT
ncbi:hypothetical protein GJ496_003634, partial [Pomphorhynchus laevis]